MRCLIVAVLALCAACGNLPDPFELIEPTSNCLGPFHGAHLTGDEIRSNERLLKRLFESPWLGDHDLTHRKLLGSDKEFCMSFGGISITYETTDTITCEGKTHTEDGRPFIGCNDSHGIRLARDGAALAHELLHTYELEHLIFNTAEHPSWEDKGFYSIQRYYAQAAVLATPDALALP